VLLAVGAAALLASLVYIATSLEPSALGATLDAGLSAPGGLALAVLAYACAFAARALAWSRVLPAIPFGQSLAALHVSTLGNHLLPFRLGEALRVTSVVRRARVPLAPAVASTVMLRAGDVLAVTALALVCGPQELRELLGGWRYALAGAGVALTVLALLALRRVCAARGTALRLPPLRLAALVTVSWLLESVVMWQAAHWAGIDLGFAGAVTVTALTIASQVVAIAPGGIGTYEAVATASLVAYGADPALALAAAVAAHAVKTAYALVAGGVAVVYPSPGLLGNLRLGAQRRRSVRPTGESPLTGDRPVVLFLPARDEEETVAAVVRETPPSVHGRPVVCLVVDDGSTDGTAERAAEAGALVVSHPVGRGLGAAVRRGLREAVARDAAAVAFCDADGEYRPAELERIVAPILEGDADYVVGSRFDGEIGRMLPHRRLGNKVLTLLLRIAAREPISDGQSGYRALSAEAAREAEIIHDFNYAQVLTLDLLGKGFRYAEVPISYSFRRNGRSFVRLVPYLRAVVPAVYRELNDTADAAPAAAAGRLEPAPEASA
jgi:uncharacterized membrane protein YbhN (UPF0104 family)